MNKAPTGMKFVCIAWFDESGKIIPDLSETSWAVHPPDKVATPEMRKQFRDFVTESVFTEGVLAEDDGKTTQTVCPESGATKREERRIT